MIGSRLLLHRFQETPVLLLLGSDATVVRYGVSSNYARCRTFTDDGGNYKFLNAELVVQQNMACQCSIS